MKIVLFGANGFLGSKVSAELAKTHQVVTVAHDPTGVDHQLDLTDLAATKDLLVKEQPDVIVSCAGIVDKGERARLNVTFTTNICEAVKQAGLKPKRIVISGSAGEYGQISSDDLPVGETTPINAAGIYAESKAEETAIALRYGEELTVEVIIARIFNPLGAGMAPGMLLPNLMRQAAAIKAGEETAFEVSRLDSKRDYIDVRDVARAFRALVESRLRYSVYNIGSGKVTTNELLIQNLKELFDLPGDTEVHETSSEPEALVACQADIARMQQDTNWTPQYTLREALQGALDENRK